MNTGDFDPQAFLGKLNPQQRQALLQHIMSLGNVGDEQQQLQDQIGQNYKERNAPPPPPHTTGLGAALGGLGEVLGGIGSRRQESGYRDQQRQLLGRRASLRAQLYELMYPPEVASLPGAVPGGGDGFEGG